MIVDLNELMTAARGIEIQPNDGWGDIGGTMTCSEVVAVADLFTVLGLNRQAEFLMTGHFYSDATEGEAECEAHGDGAERDVRIVAALMYAEGTEPF